MATQKSAKLKRIQNVALVLLVVAGLVNYLDRSTLSIANTSIAEEMNLDTAQMGVLLAAFVALALAQVLLAFDVASGLDAEAVALQSGPQGLAAGGVAGALLVDVEVVAQRLGHRDGEMRAAAARLKGENA